jgi:vacuolar-type H+-ATPase subunit E/Vma4
MMDDDVQEESLSELPFPARRTKGPKFSVAEDPFGSRGQFPETLEETAPQDEVARAAEVSRRGNARIPKFPTVETMYAAYPDIHRAGKVRVVRTEPKWWVDAMSGQRLRVNGILCKHENPISTGEIESRFGGYKYEVYGMLEKYERDDPGGPAKLVDVAVAEFEIPSDPIAEVRPIEEGQMFPYFNRRGAGGHAQQQQQHSAPGEWGPVLQFAKEMARGNGEATPSTAFETLARQGEMTTQQIQALARQNIDALEKRNERLESTILDLQTRMHDKPDNLGSIIQGVAALNQSTRTSASSEELQVLKDQHDREMSRMRDDGRHELDRLSRERDREVERIRADADARVERAEEKQKDLRESFERREREVRDEYERRERQLRDEQNRQAKAQAENYERRIEDMRQNHDREIRMLKSMQDNTLATTSAAHGVELRAAQTELAKLAADLGTKQQLVDAAIAEKNRPLMDQVAEVKNLAEALGIASDKDDMPPPPPPTGENAPLYEKLIMALMQKADTLLPQLSALAGKGGSPSQAQGGVPAAAAMMQGQAPPPGLPPRPTQRMRFSDAEGPPVMQPQSHPMSSQLPPQQEREQMPATSYAPMAPMPYVPPGQASPSQIPPSAVQYPAAGETVYPTQPATMMQPAMMQAATPTAPAAPPSQIPPQSAVPQAGEFVKPTEAAAGEGLTEKPWSQFEWIPLPPHEIQGLSETLMRACVEKIEPQALVQSFLDEHGIDVISLIPQVIDVDKFIDSVRADPATRATILATGKGKRFLEDVWQSINQAVEQKAASETQQGPSEPSPDESES